MTIGDTRKTTNLLEEVKVIVTTFMELSTPDYSRFCRTLLFLEVLQPAADLSGLGVAQGEILCQKKLDLEGLKNLASDGKTAEQALLQIASIRQFHSMFSLIPSLFPLEPVLECVLTVIVQLFYSDPT
jgi:hypothetical protein